MIGIGETVPLIFHDGCDDHAIGDHVRGLLAGEVQHERLQSQAGHCLWSLVLSLAGG